MILDPLQVLHALRECEIVSNALTIDIFEGISGNVQDIRDGRELPPLVPPTDLEDYVYALQAAIEAQKGIFGRDLTEFVEVPEVVVKSIGFLDRHGLYITGLFRVPGNEDHVNELKRAFNEGAEVKFEDSEFFEISSVYDVASLLKSFFRELPQPLIPRVFFRQFVSLYSVDDEEFIRTMKSFVEDPQFYIVNSDCLRFLLGYLVRVVRCSTYNKMTADNLAIVFAPTLLKPPDEEDISLLDLQPCIACVKRMIDHAEAIWDNIWDGYPSGA